MYLITKSITVFMLYITFSGRLAGSTQNVQCDQLGTAVLPFHFPFISGPEDLNVSWIKMETIDGDTEPLVICTLYKGAVDYQAEQYRNRTEIRADASSGNLELILKDVEKSDEGLYKCQATGMKSHGEEIYELSIQSDTEPDKTFTYVKDILFATILLLVVFFTLLVYYYRQQKLNTGNRVRFMVFAGILLLALGTALGLFCYWHKYGAISDKKSRNLGILIIASLMILAVPLVFLTFHFNKKYQRKNSTEPLIAEKAFVPGPEKHECAEEDVPLSSRIQVWSTEDVFLKPGMTV